MNHILLVTGESYNNTHEYYATTKNNSFQSATINCGTSYCHINCDIESGCYGLTINAVSSDILIVNCINYQSCESVKIYASSTYFKIQCNAIESCKHGIIHAQNTLNVDLNCNNYDSCRNISLNASHTTQTNINCLGQYTCSNSLFEMTYATYVNITANNQYALYLSTIYGQYLSGRLNINYGQTLLNLNMYVRNVNFNKHEDINTQMDTIVYKSIDNNGYDLFANSGVGRLTQILESHIQYIHLNDDLVVNQLLVSEDKTLLDAKKKAIKSRQTILLEILMDPFAIGEFLNAIVYTENLFNKIYCETLRNEQRLARMLYAPNIDKYDILSNKNQNNNKVIINEDINSFVTLVFRARHLYFEPFKIWINLIERESKKQNINIIELSGAKIKELPRTVEKAFYEYKKDGYKHLKDILRCNMVFKTFKDIYSVLNIIDNNIEILRIKDRFQPQFVPFGYRDILINFYCPKSKIICELQLHHIDFYKYKQRSHNIYIKARLFDYINGNYAYEYAQEFARPKIGDVIDIEMNNNKENNIDSDLQMNGIELLIYWRLSKYIKPMIEEDEAWQDPINWQYLKQNDLKNDIGFKTSHARLFLAKYKDWLNRKKQ